MDGQFQFQERRDGWMSRPLCELSRSPGIGSLTILGTTTNVRLTLDQHVLAQLCLLATLDQAFSDIQVRPRGVDSASPPGLS